MENRIPVLLALLPLTVMVSFIVHWFTIRRLETAQERLPFCRGAYLAFSFQLVLFSWIALVASGSQAAARFLIPLGMTVSFAGDFFNLQFPSVTRAVRQPFLFGILSFMLAQLFYIAGYLSLIPFDELVSRGHLYPLLAVFLVLPAVLFRLRVYNPERPASLMRGAFLYGFILSAMAAVALAAALARGGYWLAVAGGAGFFLLSDAVMGETTIHGRHPRFEYQVPWVTYLTAQGLIIFGMAVLAG